MPVGFAFEGGIWDLNRIIAQLRTNEEVDVIWI